MNLLGLCGYPMVGKDEVADFLVREHGFTRISFADPLRESLLALNPLIPIEDNRVVRLRELVDGVGWTTAKRNKEVRELLQRMGTEAGRDIHGDDCWVAIAERKLRACETPVVFTDVRFSNEVSLVRKYKGFILQLSRPGHSAVNNHKSEKLDYNAICDGHIVNNGSLVELQNIIDDFATEWLKPQFRQLSFEFSH